MALPFVLRVPNLHFEQDQSCHVPGLWTRSSLLVVEIAGWKRSTQQRCTEQVCSLVLLIEFNVGCLFMAVTFAPNSLAEPCVRRSCLGLHHIWMRHSLLLRRGWGMFVLRIPWISVDVLLALCCIRIAFMW